MDTHTEHPADSPDALDLDAIAADLDSVEMALARLDDGSYWSDEGPGEARPDERLAESPIAHRA